MNGEFNGFCSHYYTLTQILAQQDEYLENLLNHAMHYAGQTRLSDLDDIIKCYRKIQRAKERRDKTFDDLQTTQQTILYLMQYFNIAPGTVLTGEVTDEVEFEIWEFEADTLHVKKTKDLVPPVDEGNSITIRFCNKKKWSDGR
ncbi:MAG: hypothetical protein ABI203_04110 [Mucilaginibacter sp.]